MEHRLKTWPPFFKDVLLGNKNFELRKNDRDFQEGDILILEEWDPVLEDYTGLRIRKRVSCVVRGGEISPKWGLQPGFCIMSLKRIAPPREEQGDE